MDSFFVLIEIARVLPGLANRFNLCNDRRLYTKEAVNPFFFYARTVFSSLELCCLVIGSNEFYHDDSVNPVLDQLNQNVQETLSIWSRPLTALVGSTPASSASASPTATKASPPRRDGSTADPPFTAPKPFLQGLFEPQQQLHDWWKGYVLLSLIYEAYARFLFFK